MLTSIFILIQFYSKLHPSHHEQSVYVSGKWVPRILCPLNNDSILTALIPKTPLQVITAVHHVEPRREVFQNLFKATGEGANRKYN